MVVYGEAIFCQYYCHTLFKRQGPRPRPRSLSLSPHSPVVLLSRPLFLSFILLLYLALSRSLSFVLSPSLSLSLSLYLSRALSLSLYYLSFDHSPSLWPSGIDSRLGRNRLWVRFLAVSDIYPMFIEPTITWILSGFSGYIWLDTKIVLKKMCLDKISTTELEIV